MLVPLIDLLLQSPGQLLITRSDNQIATVPLSFTDTLSAPAVIPGTAIAVRLRSDAPFGTQWILSSTTGPTADLGDLVFRIEQSGDAVLLPLFGLMPVEPYKTWKALWESDLPLPYRLGGVLLAMIQRTEEVRLQGG